MEYTHIEKKRERGLALRDDDSQCMQLRVLVENVLVQRG